MTQTLDTTPRLRPFEAYAPRPDVYDEMVTTDRKIRPHWKTFADSFQAVGEEELTRRWEQARRLIQENGVTYNVYGDPRGIDRPWELDPIPQIISHDEWANVEAGLVQRAVLIDRMLADLYGPQKLLAEGLLPPELVFAHPGFLRPCHGLKVPDNRYLHLYGVDLARNGDGSIVAMGNRTQAPSGAGYALENRIVLSQTLPDVFRDCQVHRLASFFRTFRNTLTHLALHHRESPRVVVLTPGPYNEAYFEHAYLARYLGYTLVEGSDLTVRNDCLFLKTLGGLQQVDVVLRRMDDDYCDPMELRPSSTLGVAGLVNAVREGNVSVANALGSGLLQTSAVLPFLPKLCRALLREDLKLLSAVTWWCGEPTVLQHVLVNLHKMVIKTTYPFKGLETALGGELSRSQLAELAARIKSAPHSFVAQEQMHLSTTPSMIGNRPEPRYMVTRCYLAADGDSYKAMPGGLTRFSASTQTMFVSMQKGGGSKDTWVLSDKPVEYVSLLAPMGQVMPIELNRFGGGLPSRAADNLFWLGRYAERADAFLRLFRGILLRLVERSGADLAPEITVLLRTFTHVTRTYPGFVGENGPKLIAAPEKELFHVIFDENRSGSLRSTVVALHRLASTVRDQLSTDAWRFLNNLYQEFVQLDQLKTRQIGDLLAMSNRMLMTLAAFAGLASESMTRGHAWSFLDMGRRIERAICTVSLLHTTIITDTGDEAPVLQAVLEVADSIMTYRRRYQTSLHVAAVLDLLLIDESNPRSVVYQLLILTDHIQKLPREQQSPTRSPEERIVMSLTAAVRLADIERLSRADESSHQRVELDDLFDRLHMHLPALSDAISQVYLSHTAKTTQLTDPGAEILYNPINSM